MSKLGRSFGFFLPGKHILNWLTKGKLDSVIDNLVASYSGVEMTNAQKQALKYEDELADENADEAYRKEVAFQEAYLTPEAQLRSMAAGYDALGLNRMLMAGAQPGASASTAPSAGTPSGSGESKDISGILGNVIGAVMQSQKLKIEQSAVDADNALKGAQTEYQNIVNRWEEKNRGIDYDTKVANLAIMNGSLKKILADADVAEIYATFAPALFSSQVTERLSHADQLAASAALSRAQVNLTDAEIQEVWSKVRKNNKEVEQMNATIMKIEEECIVLGTQAGLNEQQIAESKGRVAKYEAQVQQIGKQIGLTEKEIQYYEWNHARKYETSFRTPLGGNSTAVYQDIGSAPPAHW